MNSVAVIPAIVLIVVVVTFLLVWHFVRSREILERWAKDGGFEILERDYRHLAKGPFFWTSSRGQAVYFVKVRDRSGAVLSGWVRCGGWWSGLFSDKAEVKWSSKE